jgi:uncharacterized protein
LIRENSAYKITIVILLGIIILLCLFILSRPKKPAVKVGIPLKGKIAIVLDDWGYNLNNLPIISQLRYPITASILPNLGYSQEVAQQMHKRGFEVIMHLPMQPHEKLRLEKDTITVGMQPGTISSIIERDLRNIGFADGVSNHMGSAATEDPVIMKAVFAVLKRKNIYFLDSFVTSGSVCSELAGKANLKFAKRDVFLDNEENPEYIKKQIYKLKMKAAQHGYAIGIGHDRRVTLEVLREVMPELAKEGYKFVLVSELVR